MASQIKVDPTVLSTAESHLRQASTTTTDALGALASACDSATAGVVGDLAVAQEFQLLRTRLHAHLQLQSQALDELGTNVRQSSATYQGTDLTVARSFVQPGSK